MMRWSPSATRRRIVAAALFLLVLGGGRAALVPALVARSMAGDEDEGESTVKAPSRISVQNGVTVLTLDATTRQNGGIETAHPTPPPAVGSVRGYGTVLDAEPLTEFGNRYLDAKVQVQTAEAKLAVSRAAFERAKTLYKDQRNMSAAQLQSAEGAFQVDQTALVAAQSRLTTVAASAQQAWGPVLGKALVDGAPLVKRLVQRREYLVKVTLPPGVTVVQPPETAVARLSDGGEARLQFVSLATTADPRLQAIGYFYSAAAGPGILPGLNIAVLLPVPMVERGVVVPEAAVVWLQGKAWIYLSTGPNTFVRREIAPDHPGPEGGYVVTGLPPDARIAVRGAQMLLSEEFRAQVQSAGEED